MKELQSQLGTALGNQSKYHHLRDIFCISNTMDYDEEFERLRLQISGTARQMHNWGELMPLKWILFEHLIEINKKERKDFITFSNMLDMAKHPDINMVDIDDVLVFLRFQHKVGNIIFFNDIPNFIILNPQWLIDAFRCLVSHDIDPKLQHRNDWIEFEQNGQISESLITELFKSKLGSRCLGQTENLLKVMEKFDILVRIDKTCLYIMPSMMPSISFDDVCKTIGIEQPQCKRTSWLCLKFEFLPPAFFNHFYVWFIRRYTPIKVSNGKQSLSSLFRGICIFDLDKSKCTKLLVTMSTDTIALQLLSFSDEEKDLYSICSNIRKDLIEQSETIKRRYDLTIFYELHFKCSNGRYYESTMSHADLKQCSQYYCEQHRTVHQSEDICSPWMRDVYEVSFGQKSWKVYISIHIQLISQLQIDTF